MLGGILFLCFPFRFLYLHTKRCCNFMFIIINKNTNKIKFSLRIHIIMDVVRIFEDWSFLWIRVSIWSEASILDVSRCWLQVGLVKVLCILTWGSGQVCILNGRSKSVIVLVIQNFGRSCPLSNDGTNAVACWLQFFNVIAGYALFFPVSWIIIECQMNCCLLFWLC